MTQEEWDSILIPGADNSIPVIDLLKWQKIIEETHRAQEAILKQKIIRPEDLNQIITI